MVRLLAFCFALIATPAQAEAPRWIVDHGESRLGFVTYWQNAPVNGEFKTWRADIRFDPADLAASSVRVEIETGSADTAYADRDAEIKKPDWFSIEAFPKATFAADAFRHLGGDAYEAEGALTIKGVAVPTVLPFTLTIDGASATMAAEVPVSRLAFNVGDGQWRATDFIRDEVRVQATVKARREE